MVNIRSVREPINAPEQSIMGGALQGFSAFANNANKKKAAEQENRDKLGLALLTAYAQQDRNIAPDPSGGVQYGGQNYSVGQGSPNVINQKKLWDMGLGNIPQQYKEVQARKRVADRLNKNSTFQTWTSSGNANDRRKAEALEEYLIARELGLNLESPDLDNSAVKLIKSGHKWSPAGMAYRYGIKPAAQYGASKAKEFFGKKNKALEQAQEDMGQAAPKYKENDRAIKDGVEYKRNKNGVWKPSK